MPASRPAKSLRLAGGGLAGGGLSLPTHLPSHPAASMLPLLVATAAAAAAAATNPAWMRANLPVDQRVALLLKQMTNAEKQAQAVHLTVRTRAAPA